MLQCIQFLQCLLGQRYGNRPLQAKIPQTEYQVIIESLNNLSEEEKTELNLDIPLLDFWYQCDENSEPPAMILTVSVHLLYNIFTYSL